MSNPVQRGPGNDAFGGGALIRAAPPTSGPTGALPGPNTSTPLGGVNPPSTPFFARPNSGTNIRIPYNRVVPLSDPRGGGLKAVVKPDGNNASSPEEWYTHMHADTQSKTLMSETDTLHATRIAFVLAKKSNVGITSQTADEDALRDFSYAINSAIAPVLPGTQKLQKLCSLEYLQRYIDTVANRAGFASVIDLGARPTDANANDPGDLVKGGVPPLSNNKLKEWPKKSGLLADVYREASRRHGARTGIAGYAAFTTDEGTQDKYTHKMRKSDESVVSTFAAATNAATTVDEFLTAVDNKNTALKGTVGFSGLPPSDASLLDIGDLGRLNSAVLKGVNYNPSLSLGTKVLTQAAGTTFDDDATIKALNDEIAKKIARDSGQPKVYQTLRQGIFTMDEGPFLRGYGMDAARTLVKAGFVGALQKLAVSDYSEGRCRGDDVAFAVLEDRLTALGLFDWTPDGIMLSKFDNMPLDKLEDQRIDARDGALYNVCIQGPALTTTWTGDPSMEVLPMDKVFVVVVADLIIGKLQLSEQLPVGPAIADATPSAAAQTAAYNSFKNAIDNLTTFQLIPVYSFATIGDTGKGGAFDSDADFLDKLKGAQIVSVVGNWFPYDDAAGPQVWAIATDLPGDPEADDVRTKMLAALQAIGPRIVQYRTSDDKALAVAANVDGLVASVQNADTKTKLKTARDDLRALLETAQDQVLADAVKVGVPAVVYTAAANFTAELLSLQTQYVYGYTPAVITTLNTATRDPVKGYYAAADEYYGAFGKAETDGTLDALLAAANTVNAILPGSVAKVQIFLKDSTSSANVPKVADLELQEALKVFNAYLTGTAISGTTKPPSRQAFMNARAKIMEATQVVNYGGSKTGLGLGKTFAVGTNAYEDWKQEARIEYDGANTKLTRRLCNFRVQLATSSQIINSSELKFDVNGEQMPGSRMGLKLGTRVSEYIVGGWCIGTVTDAAASRASMPSGMPMGPRSAPNTAAINLHVNIEWWNGDKMHRSYCNYKGNEKGLIRPRFERPEQDGSNNDILSPVSTSVNLPMAPKPKAKP